MGGDQRGGRQQPKRISVADLDAALFKLALAEQGKPVRDEPDEEELPDEIRVRYTPEVCMELWSAWRDHHVMPVSGGYLQQPAAWRKVIRLFNQRHHLAWKAVTDGEEWSEDEGEAQGGNWDDLTG